MEEIAIGCEAKECFMSLSSFSLFSFFVLEAEAIKQHEKHTTSTEPPEPQKAFIVKSLESTFVNHPSIVSSFNLL
jgi:hypothetical protein